MKRVSDMRDFAVILPAAGRSTRFHGFSDAKPFVDLCGTPVWQRTVQAFARRSDVRRIILVLPPDRLDTFRSQHAGRLDGIDTVAGGSSRAASVVHGMQAVPPDCPFVAVHDAARPLVSDRVIDTVFDAARGSGAAIPGIPVTSTVKRVNSRGLIEQTVDRRPLRLAQTPQAFARSVLESALRKAADTLDACTDEAAVVEAAGHPVTMTAGCPLNIKITTADDFHLAERLLSAATPPPPS